MPTRNERNFTKLQSKVSDANALRAYAVTGLDSANRRREALGQLDKICELLGEWKFLGNKPAESQGVVETALTDLTEPENSLKDWVERLKTIATDIPNIPRDPGYSRDDDDQRAVALLRKMTAMVQDLSRATDEINQAKTQIGEVWKAITGPIQSLSQAIETEVKQAVARLHNEGIETLESISKVTGSILGLLGVLDPTLLGEVALKGLKVSIEAAAEAGKLAAERIKAAGMTMDDAMKDYDEWAIPLASAERWKGAVKVAIHGIGVAIPKSDIVMPFIDSMVEQYFETAVKKGKAEQAKKKAGGATDESAGDYWENVKKGLMEQFDPDKAGASDVAKHYTDGLAGMMDTTGVSGGGIGAEILGKIYRAVTDELAEKFLPIEPAQPVPALDIKARLGDLKGTYTEALTKEMDPQLKSEFDEAMAGI